MRDKQTLKETCLSEVTHISAWCMCKTASDMCVADPSVEQSSNSMESCTRENNDSTATPDTDPPLNPSDDSCCEIRIDEVFSLEEESPGKKSDDKLESETSDTSVMIIEDDTEPEKTNKEVDYCPKSETEDNDVKEGASDGVEIIEISEVESETDKVSAEVISEIDKEILKSLQGTFKNLKTLIKGIKDEKGGNSHGRKKPSSGASFDTSASEFKAKPAPKTTDGSCRKGSDQGKDNKINGESKAKGDNAAKAGHTGSASLTWKTEHYGNVLEEGEYSAGKAISVTQKRNSTEDRVTENQSKDEKQEEDVVWICFVCAKEFSNQQELMSHQDTCDEDLPGSGNGMSPADNLNHKEQNPDTTIKLELAYDASGENRGVPIIRQISETETVSINAPLSLPGFSAAETSQPVPAHLTKVGSGIKSLPLGLPRRRKIQKRKIVKEIYIPPPRDTYFECLGLGQTPAVEEIFKSPRKSVSEDDCAIIDLTVEDAKAQHSSPMTPRTRSLMSQLSRDESGRRRHLSFSGTPMKPEPKPEEKQVDKEKKSDTSDSESSESSEEEAAKRKSVPFKSALLAIPLTSPLGQRLKNHWQNENKVPVISNVEAFCKTDGLYEIAQEVTDKKNPMMEKLRHRPPPQVTFKFTKKYLNKWFHKYKFNSLDRHEFQKILKNGLERESRRRLKRMKPCKVVLDRVSQKDIKYWTTPRVRPSQYRVLQCFRQLGPSNVRIRANFQNVRSILRHSRPMHQRMVMLNQLNRSRLTPPILHHTPPNSPFKYQSNRMPTPQLLVRPHGGGNGMRLEVMNVNQRYPSLQGVLASPYTEGGAQPLDKRSQKRKQTFDNVRRDDNLVICLSSDDEEDTKKGSTQCAQCSRGLCSVHQKSKTSSVNPTAGKMIGLLPTNTQGSSVKSSVNSASFRVFGNSFLQNAARAGPVKQTNMDYTNVRMMNGQMYFQQPAQASTSQGQRSQASASHVNLKEEPSSKDKGIKETVTVSAISTEPASEPAGNGRSQSDSEYMDYEVICIESDEDD